MTSPATSLAIRTWWQRLAGVRAGVREAVLIAALYVGYTSSRLLASNDEEQAVHRAKVLLKIEHAVDLDWEHGVNQFFLHHDVIGLLGCYWYSTAHYIVTLVVLIWLYSRGRSTYLPARRALVIATVLALCLYLMLPTAPPRFMSGYVDILSIHANQGWWGSDASAPRGMGDLTNALAAFPSLHAGWSLWVALVLHKSGKYRVVRILGWAHALITAAVVVGTANHWVLDVLVGWMVILVGYVAVSAFTSPSPAAVAATAEPTLTGDPVG